MRQTTKHTLRKLARSAEFFLCLLSACECGVCVFCALLSKITAEFDFFSKVVSEHSTDWVILLYVYYSFLVAVLLLVVYLATFRDAQLNAGKKC